MSDFHFYKIPGIPSWVISDPKRGRRPHEATRTNCQFCHASIDKEVLYKIGEGKDSVRVLENKFPFASLHEIFIHTKDHKHHLFDLTQEQVALVIQAWKLRFLEHKDKGIVCIFSNVEEEAGESIPHSHSQLAVLPDEMEISAPRLEESFGKKEVFLIGEFELVSPPYAEWPDEVWIVPKRRGKLFCEIEEQEIKELSFILKRALFLLSLRHGHAFPHNLFIYPFRDWYLRIIPRAKTLGGLEVGTGINVNTQDPAETVQFLKDHFYEENEKLISKRKALYRKII